MRNSTTRTFNTFRTEESFRVRDTGRGKKSKRNPSLRVRIHYDPRVLSFEIFRTFSPSTTLKHNYVEQKTTRLHGESIERAMCAHTSEKRVGKKKNNRNTIIFTYLCTSCTFFDLHSAATEKKNKGVRKLTIFFVHNRPDIPISETG